MVESIEPQGTPAHIEVVDLAALAENLLDRARTNLQHKASHLVIAGPRQRTVLMAISRAEASGSTRRRRPQRSRYSVAAFASTSARSGSGSSRPDRSSRSLRSGTPSMHWRTRHSSSPSRSPDVLLRRLLGDRPDRADMDEHDIVNALTALRAACAAADLEATGAAVEVMAGLLHPHTHAEEIGLFTVMGEDEEFHDHIETLCGEHRSLDAFLDDLAGGAFDRFDEFELALRRHIDKEDNGLFPAAAIALTGPDWERVTTLTPPALTAIQ